MNGDLEQQLRALAATLELAPAPDVVPAVLARLPDRAASRRRTRSSRRTRATRRVARTRRSLAIALAAVLALVAGALAVPTARHAILQDLGLRGVRIERVAKLPPVAPGTGRRLALGQRIALAGARHAASFTALLTPSASAAYIGHDIPGGRISLLVGRILITEFRASPTPTFLKLAGPGTDARRVRVNGSRGAYLFGAPVLIFEQGPDEFETDRVRIAGNVLIWQQGPLTISIEGTRTLRRALAIAHTLR